MRTPDISIVIPTFRRPHHLICALSSVLGQQGVTIEVLVVDDSPERSAAGVVHDLNDDRVQYLPNPAPTGGFPSVVRNLGWPKASGSYIHFLDDDDIVPDGYYADAKAAFLRRPDIGMVFGKIEPFGDAPEWQLDHERVFFESAWRRAAKSARFGPRWAFTARMLFEATLLVCSAVLIRRECVAELNGFDPTIRLMEDADFYTQAMRRFGTYYVDRTALYYRIGSPSLMHSPSPDPEQLKQEREGRNRMRRKYRKKMGFAEYHALKILSRTVLRLI